ncbi:MAG TPA: UDP-N-acetyl-D-glucosamine dehydrogenase [Candidatus Riflebacteria bacterium]|jgi:predicted dehydrogenase|nr:MAG: UDP-N-acetyl-D-glucosamine dehydrogenase [Candidatus Riflebacteria bacterium HGW-Riflebacteria-1]HAE41181.1 UDP-N-acetyl-D-glucosamine dehydrogenase [Candidatus Riflebacteria bacterium]
MDTQLIKTGVIGVGHLGQHHARLLAELEGVKLVGVVDVNEAGRELAAKYSVPFYTDYRELEGKVDAVTVVVPTFLHHEVARFFLERNVHTFIEKPVTKTLEEANDLVSLAGKKQLTLQVGHIERFNAAMIKLQSLCDNPRFIECQRMGPFSPRIQDVGVVQDLMIHDIDIVLSLVRSPIRHIDAVGIPVLTDNEDIANAHIVFENGCIANLTASRISDERIRKLRIFELDKYCSLDYANQAITLRRKSNLEEKIIREELEVHKAEPLRLELEHFVSCIRDRKKPLVTIEDGKNALEVAVEILEQIKHNLPRKR